MPLLYFLCVFLSDNLSCKLFIMESYLTILFVHCLAQSNVQKKLCCHAVRKNNTNVSVLLHTYWTEILIFRLYLRKGRSWCPELAKGDQILNILKKKAMLISVEYLKMFIAFQQISSKTLMNSLSVLRKWYWINKLKRLCWKAGTEQVWT